MKQHSCGLPLRRKTGHWNTTHSVQRTTLPDCRHKKQLHNLMRRKQQSFLPFTFEVRPNGTCIFQTIWICKAWSGWGWIVNERQHKNANEGFESHDGKRKLVTLRWLSSHLTGIAGLILHIVLQLIRPMPTRQCADKPCPANLGFVLLLLGKSYSFSGPTEPTLPASNWIPLPAQSSRGPWLSAGAFAPLGLRGGCQNVGLLEPKVMLLFGQFPSMCHGRLVCVTVLKFKNKLPGAVATAVVGTPHHAAHAESLKYAYILLLVVATTNYVVDK